MRFIRIVHITYAAYEEYASHKLNISPEIFYFIDFLAYLFYSIFYTILAPAEVSPERMWQALVGSALSPFSLILNAMAR
jgi:hypothetical protein